MPLAKTRREFPLPVLALDPATHTGFCHSCGAKGVWRLETSSTDHPGLRLAWLRDYILSIAREHGCRTIAYEEASFGGVSKKGPQLHVMSLHNQLRGVILLTARDLGATVVGYTPTAIKAFLGDGRAKKADVIRLAKLHGIVDTSNSDIADSAVILQMALQGYWYEKATAPKRRRGKGHSQKKPSERTLF